MQPEGSRIPTWLDVRSITIPLVFMALVSRLAVVPVLIGSRNLTLVGLLLPPNMVMRVPLLSIWVKVQYRAASRSLPILF